MTNKLAIVPTEIKEAVNGHKYFKRYGSGKIGVKLQKRGDAASYKLSNYKIESVYNGSEPYVRFDRVK